MKENLNNFESFIKSSLNGHEAEYSASAWDRLQNAMGENATASSDSFESFVKESLDGYEAPYSPSAWTAIAKLLNKAAIPFYKTKGFIAIASILVFAGIAFLAKPKNDSLTKETTENNKTIADNKTVLDNTTSIDEQKTLNHNNAVNSTIINENIVIENSTINEDLTDNNLDERIDNTIVPPTTPPTGGNEVNSADAGQNGEDVAVIASNLEPIKNYSVAFMTNNEVCQNEEIVLFPEIIEDDLSYEWYINDEKVSDNMNLVTSMKKAGINTVVLIGKNKQGNEVAKSTEVIRVSELPKGRLIHTAAPYSLVNKHNFKLNDNSSEVVWNFGDGNSSKNTDAFHTYSKVGQYKLSYAVVSKEGCKANFEKDINIKGYYNIREDHFFSPDGDGSLDFFLPEELNQVNQSFEMVVYNRQNKVVFKTNDLNNPWNGRNEEGIMVPFGAYVWVINLTNELGHKELYKGTVTKASH